ncbi:MAG: zinc-ribbon domain containing protein [Patescibacteria group bacterium]
MLPQKARQEGAPPNFTGETKDYSAGMLIDGTYDLIMTCDECHEQFALLAKDQVYLAGRGFAKPPKHCKTCHAEHKMSRQRASHLDQFQNSAQA